MGKLHKKMEKRLLKLFKRTAKGHHDAMMEAIELLIDTKDSKLFDEGYKSCLSDITVRSYHLAEYLHNKFADKIIDKDETAKAIEEYFNKALNGK